MSHSHHDPELKQGQELEDIITEALDCSYSWNDTYQALKGEMWKNKLVEAGCIGACEAGEIGGEAVFYQHDPGHPGMQALVGFGTGVLLGGSYAFGHVAWESRGEVNINSTGDLWEYMKQAAKYASATELGCVISATGTESLFGLASPTPDPLTWTNIGFKTAGLLPAYMIGLGAMSAATLYQEGEAGRFVSEKGILSTTADSMQLTTEVTPGSWNAKNVLHIDEGTGASVSEYDIPGYLGDEFDSEEQSLYRVMSSVARHEHEQTHRLLSGVTRAVENTGHTVRHVHNPFNHEH